MNIYEKQASFYLLQSNWTQRELAEKMSCSLGTVNNTLKRLTDEAWIDSSRQPTTKLLNQLEVNHHKRAIILAAGFGVRSVPLNMTTPKPLIKVNNERLIERLIKQLHAAGVEHISIVVGFMKERFEYLIDRYNVELIFNSEYKRLNNIYSLSLAVDQLDNTYIVPGDIWLAENPFSKNDFFSWYMISRKKDRLSSLKLGKQNEFIRSKDGEAGMTMIGIAYISSEIASWLVTETKQAIVDPIRQQSFWEELLLGKDWKIQSLVPRVLSEQSVVDINTYEDLRLIDKQSNHLNSAVIKLIAETLRVSASEVTDIVPLKKGMTNRSFSFLAGNRKFIMRIPGEGTQRLIDRQNEAKVYQLINDFPFVENVRYINPDNGYKISELLEAAQNSDPQALLQVKQCMNVLRQLHNQKVRLGNRFELYQQIEFYESLWGGQPSIFEDYDQIKNRVYQLKSFVITNKNPDVLCHIDANYDNFVYCGPASHRQLKLIDWEYAGEQDPLVDVAMFSIYAGYSKKQTDWLLNAYLEDPVTKRDQILLYSYISICGLLWSNWCQYKHNLGVEFGEYFMQQYRFAKEYSKFALHLISSMED